MKTLIKIYGILVAIVSILATPIDLNAQNSSQTLLWKIEGKELEEPSYIYGTIHMICPDDFIITEATKKAIESSDQIVMELDMDDPQLMAKMQQLSVNPGMKNFSSQVSEEDQKVLNEFFTTNYGADLSQLGIMKPFALVSMMILKGIECEQPASYENSFKDLATEQQKEVLGLETVEYQIGIFDSIPMQEQISWLVEYASDPTSMKEELGKLISAYKKMDMNELFEISMNSAQMEGLEERLLFNRNKMWIDKIADYAKDKPTFFAVGAGHLGSDQGVIQLLKDAGYSVTAVK